MAVNQDIDSKIKQLEAALAEANATQERYRRLLEAAPDAVVVVDQQGRIVLVNAQVAPLFGYRKEELIGQSIEVLVPERARARHVDHRNHFLANHEVRPMGSGLDLAARCKDGREIPVEISLSPLETADGVLVSASIRDISDRRAVQQALRKAKTELETRVRERTAELELANKALQEEMADRRSAEEALHQAQKMEAVGQLTGGVAHDFNNLLTIINGNLQILAGHCRDDELARELIDAALQAGRRGAELNRTLLAFSRRQRLQPVLIDLSALAQGIVSMLRRTLGESIELDVRTMDNLPKALADPSQLEVALLNLAVNARDAMPLGGRLLIETSTIRFDEQTAALEGDLKPGSYVVLAVSDNGSGISEANLSRVFEPFFTTKEVGQGSGLGLAMVYGFAKQSGGHVKIYSVEGRGTTVKLFLPLAPAGGEVIHAEPERPPNRTGHERILVVEDEPDVRALAVRVLRSLGYQVLEAADGPAALSLLKNDPAIELLFTDVVLPGGMHGPDIARKARRLRPDLPVLYTSGYTGNAIAQLEQLDQQVHLISKPYAIDELAEQIRTVLDESKPAGGR
ncbi:hybrid sensor histidine kinase/response regulator [Marinobacterium zhoushanense]|uniref:histidine kinase n=1 Tax=Marinobacterium zhoushanense TaxID=1679163 RepID=A0ABQ1KE29_9GAMM|nr:PAS domain-containing hybrid sensor histidine kinase/response regulator [Marinobacterium zhoushanense]GGB96622.1 hybrid sensor histidine kinase/response regulator [Marinobacterium zhoushanense]